MCKAKARELVEVVKYFRDEFDAAYHHFQYVQGRAATEMLRLATDMLKRGRELPSDKAGS